MSNGLTGVDGGIRERAIFGVGATDAFSHLEIKFCFREEFRNPLAFGRQNNSTRSNFRQLRNLIQKFLVGVSYKPASTPVGRFCIKVYRNDMTVFNNNISLLQAEVISNGRKCAVFAYKRIIFGQVIEVCTITLLALTSCVALNLSPIVTGKETCIS